MLRCEKYHSCFQLILPHDIYENLGFFLLHQNNIHYERTDVQLGIFSLPLTQSLDKQMRKSFLRVNDANAKLMEHEVSHSRFSEVGGQKVTQSGDRSPRRSPIHGLSLLWSARGYKVPENGGLGHNSPTAAEQFLLLDKQFQLRSLCIYENVPPPTLNPCQRYYVIVVSDYSRRASFYSVKPAVVSSCNNR